MKKRKRIVAVILAAAIVISCVTCFTVFGQTALIKQYTFSEGMPSDFTPLSYDGVVKKPKIVKDSERGYVLRQYFGAGTGSGNGDPLGESYVDISENPYSGVNTSNGITFMLWVKTDDNAPWDYNDTILSFNNSTTRFALNDCPYFDYTQIGANRNYGIYTSEQYSIKGKWQHYAFTVTEQGIKIFINGEEVACRTDGNINNPFSEILSFIADSNTSLNLGLGGFFGSQDCFLDDIRFYRGEMSEEDIFEIYDSTVDFTTRNLKPVSHSGVHDPSIVTCYILADGTQVGENDPRANNAASKKWWIFGSHLACAYSDDLINWHNYASGFDENNPLMNYTDNNGNSVKFTDILTESTGYHGSDTGMWAGCVIYNPVIQKWCMYGSCTTVLPTYGYNSVLWVTFADNIEGPYTNAQPMVFTNPSFNVSNSQAYIASVCPSGADYRNKCWWNNTQRTTHTVDPTTFYDKNGNLWMIYGSYNSLFILPMDENTGLPDYNESYQRELAATNAGKNHYDNNDWYSDWYWGTRINYTNFATDYTGEGSFIYYDKDTDYYYMYLTYGGFGSLGGYNLRVFRSRNPEGPYVDRTGTGLLDYLDTDSTPVNAGLKLTGNYQWSCNSVAYMSPGHDSVLRENVDGVDKLFQMYHVRFNNRSEGFFDQMHQMAMLEDGWTVMLPYEYYGETIDYDRHYSVDEIAGSYEFIDLKDTTYHIRDESDYDHASDIVYPTQEIVLSRDGKIYGAATYRGGTTTDFENAKNIENRGIIGTWNENNNSCYASFTLGSKHYDGIFTYQFDESKLKERTLVFAACSDNCTIWGSKMKKGAFKNREDSTDGLVKQITVDNGEISDTSAVLSGNSAVVNDLDRGSALFLPENDEGYVKIDNPYYHTNPSEASISFFAKVNESSDYLPADIFMSFINSSSEWQYFTVNSAPEAHIFYRGYADFYTDSNSSYSFNEWHNFTVTVGANDTVTFYIDGVKTAYAFNKSDDYNAAQNSILEWLSSTQYIYLGKTQQPSGAEWSWDGQECLMDNICFYDRVIDEREIMQKLLNDDYSYGVSTDESYKNIGVDRVVYTHGTGYPADYMYPGNEISDGNENGEKMTYLHIPDEYDLISLTSDNGRVSFKEGARGYYLTGTVSRVDTDMALTLYLKSGNKLYKKTVYTYVFNNPVDAHIAEWNCIKNRARSLCHVSRVVGSEGSGGSGSFLYLNSPADFYDYSGDSLSGMGFQSLNGAPNTGAYKYKYSALSLTGTSSITNDTVPNAVYYVDKSGSEYWDGSRYTFKWTFTTLNGNSSAVNSTGRSVSAGSTNSAISVDTSAGVYDNSPNNAGEVREYYIHGASAVSNASVTVTMNQGSGPKLSTNHKINLTVNLFDKSAVKNKLEECDALNESNYTPSSWSVLEQARREAYAYLNNYKNTNDSSSVQQEYINALNNAVSNLDEIDYSALEQLLNTAKGISPENYTEASYEPFAKAVAKYSPLLGCASSQSQVNRAVNTVSAKLSELVPVYTVSGTVCNTNGVPIENAQLDFGSVTAVTDENGAFCIKLEAGEYELDVSTSCSFDRSYEITVDENGINGFAITLVNCNTVKDGVINAKDYAAALKNNNTAAMAEFEYNMNLKKADAYSN